MAPRAYWKGSLKLSLVTCPIALYPASNQAERTHFHQINTKTGHRLRQQMVDEQTGRVVDKDHKGRGYELSKGKYVEIEEEELEAVKLESTHTIEIDDFVPAEDIDERYLDKPYYIVPNGKAGADAFVVIRDAMKRKDKVALARVVLSNREHVIALKPLGKGLLGTTLRYPYELRDEDDYFDDIPSPRVSKDMVDLASHILDKKASKFDPHKFKDKYEAALKALVKRKAAGKTIEVPEEKEEESNVIDLMDALNQSLGRKKAATPRERKEAGARRAVAVSGKPREEEPHPYRGDGGALRRRYSHRQRVAVRAEMGWISLPLDAGCRRRGHVFEVGPGSQPLFSGSGCRGIDLARKKLCPRWRNRRSRRWSTFVRRPAAAHSSRGEPRKEIGGANSGAVSGVRFVEEGKDRACGPASEQAASAT